jgi:hypothetical protein
VSAFMFRRVARIVWATRTCGGQPIERGSFNQSHPLSSIWKVRLIRRSRMCSFTPVSARAPRASRQVYGRAGVGSVLGSPPVLGKMGSRLESINALMSSRPGVCGVCPVAFGDAPKFSAT